MDIQGPVSAEHDGWTISSASTGNPSTAEDLKQQLGADPSPAKTDPPKPAEFTSPATRAAALDGNQAPTQDAPEAPAAPAPPKPKRDPEARIGELTGKWRATERDLHSERTKREALERELQDLRAKQTAPEAPKADPKPDPATASKPKPVWAKYEEDGKSWQEYQDAAEAWLLEEADARAARAAAAESAKLEEKFKKERADDEDRRRKQAAEAVEAEAERKHQSRLAAARAKYADLDQLVAQNLHDVESPFLGHLIASTDEGAEILYHLASKPDEAHTLAQLQPNQAVGDAIRDADSPLRLLSYFAQHPDEFSRINVLPPQKALLALGRLDKQLEDAPAGPSPAASVPPVTRAAGPIRPVVPAPTTSTRKSGTAADDMDFGPEYVARKNKEEAESRRRRGY